MPEPTTISGVVAAVVAEVVVIIEKVLEAASAVSKLPGPEHMHSHHTRASRDDQA